MLTDAEATHLSVALDPSAPPSEWTAAALKFVFSLRNRGVDGFEQGGFFNPNPPTPIPASVTVPGPTEQMLRWPGSIIINFGKHKGKTLADLDPGYLFWGTQNLDKHRDAHLIQAMQWLLDDLRDRQRRLR